ncbi:hypothetical protein DSL92_01270 [Billgrantia gudaonensis]|uniref:Aldehyde dehydrogenase family protein n=1 Tax=Billgrantia gudaonensis TaxID=376427 RepID=A0A432JKH7_9GAMM|nr:hypothetical protein DSL92_01270 [Halomonas gudaonensis]
MVFNDTLWHNALPFGGVGESGMGAYHGEAGFRQQSRTQRLRPDHNPVRAAQSTVSALAAENAGPVMS